MVLARIHAVQSGIRRLHQRGRPMTTMKWGRRLTVFGAVIALGLGASTTAFSSPSSKTSNTSSISISDEYGEAWNCEFNPYSGAEQFASFGPVYEELVYMDSLKDG